VASRTDSRVVLDEMGADKLLGNGDMLFLWPGTSTLLRGQGTYMSDDEITRVIGAVATTEPQFVKELVQLKTASAGEGGRSLSDRDEFYEAAIDVVIREGRGSVSLLQRALGIGYGRAARLIDFMAEDGIVGQYNGSQAREVLLTLEQWAEMSGQSAGGGSGGTPSGPAAPRRSNTILLDRPDAAPTRPPAAASTSVATAEDRDDADDEYDEEVSEEEDEEPDDFGDEDEGLDDDEEDEEPDDDADFDEDEDEDEDDDEDEEDRDAGDSGLEQESPSADAPVTRRRPCA
jgi:S-DNA-T family DNA segregation ATPase FtsK/SpoIIIE